MADDSYGDLARTADDRAEIEALVHEYCFRLDAGDLDGVAALFEHATMGTSNRPDRLRGAEEVRTNYDGVILYDDGRPATMHCIANLAITVERVGDQVYRRATSRCYFTVSQSRPDFELRPILAGRYHDRFEKVDGASAWRFAERIIHPDRIGDLSRHMVPGRVAPPR